MRARFCLLAGLVVMAALAGCNVTSDNSLSTTKKTGEEVAVVAVGHKVPEIRGEDVTGENLKLSDYRGKVVLLDFWGNW